MATENTSGPQSSIKLVVIGDGGVGKTCLLCRYAEDRFEESHVPTIFDHKTTSICLDGRVIELNLWDTAGQEELDRLRPLSYPDSDVFLLCFSLVFPASLHNIRSKWHPEVLHHRPEAPIILVGTKLDLAGTASMKKTHQQLSREATVLAQKMGAIAYVECSARDRQNYAKPFETAVRAVLYPDKFHKNNGKRRCSFL